MKNYQQAIQQRKKQTLVSILVLLLVICFSSCTASRGSNGIQQPPIFAVAPGSPLSLACGASNVTSGDLNNDGKPDLIVTCGEARALTVLLGTKGERGEYFRPGQQITVPDSPGDIALGDLNGDNNLDVAIDSHDSYGVILLLGDGKGGLALAPNSPIVMKEGQHPHTHGLAIGDLNGDRKPDLITVNNADNDVSIVLGDGRGGFTRAPATFAVGPSPYPMALGDVNNDRHLDIIATASATGPQRQQQLASSFALTLLVNDGRGVFRASQLPLRTGQPWFAAIGDVNGDAKPDVVATHHDQSKLTVLVGDGAGRFTEGPTSPFDFGHNAFSIVLADVNNDGRLDTLAAGGEGVSVLLGDGRGNFRAATGSPFKTGRGVWRFAVADLNGDGKLDVATSNLESKSVGILLGR